MKFEQTPISGAHVVRPEPVEDERGLFARVWDAEAMAALGLDARPLQCSVSYNARRGTLRGMHLQAAPHGETKLVRCTAGAVWDVIVDVRPDSPTRGRHFAIELSQANRAMLYIPEGVAHGFQALTDGAELYYQIGGSPYVPGAARGFRHDDPAFGIPWPLSVTSIAEKDLNWPPFDPTPAR
ncbi:MAG: dTDP-4-dehydrorhamnose 3,5-epimerase family protein [Candidatus Sericytochromatia bacterium]